MKVLPNIIIMNKLIKKLIILYYFIFYYIINVSKAENSISSITLTIKGKGNQKYYMMALFLDILLIIQIIYMLIINIKEIKV